MRIAKGCVRLAARPANDNTANMVSVDHVGGTLEAYGYRVPEVDYAAWNESLKDYVGDSKKGQHAL